MFFKNKKIWNEPVCLSPVGVHNHRRDSHRADEEQADDKGQKHISFLLFILHLLPAASSAPTLPQAKARSAARGFWKRCSIEQNLSQFSYWSHLFLIHKLVYLCFSFLQDPSSAGFYLSNPALHQSVGSRTLPCLTTTSDSHQLHTKMAKKVFLWRLRYSQNDFFFCLSTVSYLSTGEMKKLKWQQSLGPMKRVYAGWERMNVSLCVPWSKTHENKISNQSTKGPCLALYLPAAIISLVDS